MDIFKISGWDLSLLFPLNGRSRIRFGENRLKTGGFLQKPRKLVGDCTISSDRGTDRLRCHPDKYCSWGEKDTRYWVHAQAKGEIFVMDSDLIRLQLLFGEVVCDRCDRACYRFLYKNR